MPGLCLSAGHRFHDARPYARRCSRDHRLNGYRLRRGRSMSTPVGAANFEQPASFNFTPENREQAKAHIAKYPPGRQASAVLPLLYIAQEQQGGWLPRAAMDHVAALLEIAPIRVYEVARYLLQACTTTPCWLRGSAAVVEACERELGIGVGGTTADGLFTLVEVE